MRRTLLSLATLSMAFNLGTTPAVAGDDDWVPVTALGAVVVAGLAAILGSDSDAKDTAKAHAADLIHFVSTPEERRELSKLESDAEVAEFLHDFFQRRDPTPGTPDNEFKEIHVARFTRAQREFGSLEGGALSDRGRAYILFGPPTERYEVLDLPDNGSSSRSWKAAEIWEYDRPAGTNRFNVSSDMRQLDAAFRSNLLSGGRMQFVFADRTGAGLFQQVHSTELGGSLVR